MIKIKLAKLIKKELQPILVNNLLTEGVKIVDLDDRLVFGDDMVIGEKYSIKINDDEMVGWTVGGDAALLLASIINYFIAQIIERKALADEALKKYREINLLYNLAEKLATCLELDTVVDLVINEANRLLCSTSTTLMLINDQNQLEVIGGLGKTYGARTVMDIGEGIAGYVAMTGKSEIVDDVVFDPRYKVGANVTHSMMCAPLKVQDQVIGVINISSEEAADYTVEDLKLLTAIALQSTSAIKNALALNKEREEAQKREAELQQQVRELKIEIDEVKRNKQVEEITETDFFKKLQEQAKKMRQKHQS